MDKKLTQQEFNEIVSLARYCMDTSNTYEIHSELQRLNAISRGLDVDPYIKDIVNDIIGFSKEASQQNTRKNKEYLLDSAIAAIKKLKLNGVDRRDCEDE